MSKELLEKLRANRRILDECPTHRFNFPPLPFMLGMKLKCLVCGGEMPITDIKHYIDGYKAAGRNPEDVFPNYYGPINETDNRS